MSILKKLDSERAKFVSLYDLVKGVSEISNCSISDAACAVAHITANQDIDFLSRKKSTKLTFKLIDFRLGPTCQQQLEVIAEKNDFPTEDRRTDFNRPDIIYISSSFNNGWYKSDLLSVFLNLVSEGGLSDFADLPCMIDSHISSAYVDWYEAQDMTAGKEALIEMRRVCAGSMTPPSDDDFMPPYLDSSHPCYSPKLAATIKAWEHAVTEHASSLKTPTKRMEEWLVENESILGLKTELKKDSKIQMAKIANFRNITGAVTTSERDENAKVMSDYNESANGMKAKLKTTPVSKLMDDEPDFDSESAF
jgi:hypothetical protein